MQVRSQRPLHRVRPARPMADCPQNTKDRVGEFLFGLPQAKRISAHVPMELVCFRGADYQTASIPAYHAHALALGRYAPINPAISTARYKTPRIASRIEKERA